MLTQCHAWLQLTVAGVHTEPQTTRGTSSSAPSHPSRPFLGGFSSEPPLTYPSTFSLPCHDFNMTQSCAPGHGRWNGSFWRVCGCAQVRGFLCRSMDLFVVESKRVTYKCQEAELILFWTSLLHILASSPVVIDHLQWGFFFFTPFLLLNYQAIFPIPTITLL